MCKLPKAILKNQKCSVTWSLERKNEFAFVLCPLREFVEHGVIVFRGKFVQRHARVTLVLKRDHGLVFAVSPYGSPHAVAFIVD